MNGGWQGLLSEKAVSNMLRAAIELFFRISHEPSHWSADSLVRAWLREAGFVNPRLLDVPAASPLVLATRP